MAKMWTIDENEMLKVSTWILESEFQIYYFQLSWKWQWDTIIHEAIRHKTAEADVTFSKTRPEQAKRARWARYAPGVFTRLKRARSGAPTRPVTSLFHSSKISKPIV
jgi:hypothetical protein